MDIGGAVCGGRAGRQHGNAHGRRPEFPFRLSGSGTNNGALFGVGWVNSPSNAGTLGPTTRGTVTVENGGQIIVDTDGNEYGGFAVGKNGGSGTVIVTGAGSAITASGNNNNTNNGGGVTIGSPVPARSRSSPEATSISTKTPSTGGASGMAIGGDPYQVGQGAKPGTGTVIVSGAGSELNVQSPYGFIAAGYTGTGTLKSPTAARSRRKVSRSPASRAASGPCRSMAPHPPSRLRAAGSVNDGPGARVQVGAGPTEP